MTLGDGKRKVLKLIDEYSSGGTITPDADIDMKMNDFFDIAQKQIAQMKPVVRLHLIEREDGKTAYEMPNNFLSVYRIWRSGVAQNGFYQWKDGKILIPERDGAAVEVEYFASPTTITGDTKDDHVFEVAEDAAQCMPFFVAAQQLVVDLVVDYSALLNLYSLMVARLDTRLPGQGQGGIQNRLYRF